MRNNNEENNEELYNEVSETDGGKNNRAAAVRMELYDWVQCFISAIVIGILIFMFCFRVITVDGSSMNPSLYHDDKIIISSLFYKPSQGDIVVLEAENFSEGPLVKRIIATGGQKVDIDFDTGIVYVDDVPLDEPYVASPTYDREDFSGPVIVPEGCVFVMGDNRNASTDSRTDSIGMIDERAILGKVYLIVIPGIDKQGNHDWSRIGSVY